MDNKRKDRESLANQLNKMLDALRSFGVGSQNPPSIYGNGGLPPEVVQRGMNTMRNRMTPPLNQQQGLPPPMQGQGGPNVSALMGGPQQGAPMPPQGRDEAGMDRMMQALTNPYQQGQNQNIGDDTRDRDMAWLRAQQGG